MLTNTLDPFKQLAVKRPMVVPSPPSAAPFSAGYGLLYENQFLFSAAAEQSLSSIKALMALAARQDRGFASQWILVTDLPIILTQSAEPMTPERDVRTFLMEVRRLIETEQLSAAREMLEAAPASSPPLDWGAEWNRLTMETMRTLGVYGNAMTRSRTTPVQVNLAGFLSSTAEIWKAQVLPKKKTVSIWSLVSDLFASPSLQNLRAALYGFYTSTLLLTMAGFGWIMVDFTNAVAGKPSFFEPGEALFAAFGVAGLIIELSLGLLADMSTPGKIHAGNS